MTAKPWRILSLLTVAALLWPVMPAGQGSVAEAAPAGGGISNVVPLVGVLVGWDHRNKIYREANNFIADRNTYYDQLRDTARRQLIEREIGGLRTSQVAAYVKLVAVTEQRRSAEIAVAETFKREARAAFHDRLESAVLQHLLGAGAVQRLLGAMVKGVDRGQGFLDTALGNLAGQGGGVLAEVERIRSTARDVEAVASAVGGRSGQGLRGAAARVAQTIERPRDVIRADLEKVQGDLAQLGDTLRTLQAAGRTPTAGALATELVIRPPGGSGDPSAQAVAILVSRLGVGNPNLKEQARAAIQAGFVARCTALASGYRAALARLNTGEISNAQAVAPCQAIDVDQLVRTAQQTQAAAVPPADQAGEPEEPTAPDEVPPLEDRCSLSGEGDFVIENLQVSSVSNNCEDSQYPFGMPAEPLLVYLAAAGRWVIVSETPESTTWAWQPTMDLQGAIVEGTAQTAGGTLVIDTSLSVPPSGTSFAPLPSDGNGLALAVMLPILPLALILSSRKRRRLALLGMALLALLLMAQSCEVYGSFSGHYTLPMPEEGFACEIPPDNPNLAEMPGSGGQVSMQLTVVDDKGVAESCTISADVTGVGILKRDGFYTEESLQAAE
jgi:hypothetical protein